jgi:hypothetical protein
LEEEAVENILVCMHITDLFGAASSGKYSSAHAALLACLVEEAEDNILLRMLNT